MNFLSNLSGFGSSSASPQTTTVTPTVTPTVSHSGVVINKNLPSEAQSMTVPIIVGGIVVLGVALSIAYMVRKG